MTDITVVVLTYNSRLDYIKKTLKSIISQTEIVYEIIISDDCSQIDFCKDICSFFSENAFSNYVIRKSNINQGTIKNYIEALMIAKGKYIVGLGPGDLLFDNMVLHDIYDFCEQNHTVYGFGNPIYYYNINNHPFVSSYFSPKRPNAYNSNDIKRQEISFFFDGFINGTCYFRERLFALKYFNEILKFAKYAEDSPSTILALSDGVLLQYFDRDMIWYESSLGISSDNKSNYLSLLSEEYKQAYMYAYNKHPDDRLLRFRLFILRYTNKVAKGMLFLFSSPFILFRIIKAKCKRKRKIVVNTYQQNLERILEE